MEFKSGGVFLLAFIALFGLTNGYAIIEAGEDVKVVCPINDKGDIVVCDQNNSKLPSDLKLEGVTPSKKNDYTCLNITYLTGTWPLRKTHIVLQCAQKLDATSKSLCDALGDENTVRFCEAKDAQQSTTVAPEKGAYCIVNDKKEYAECSEENSKFPDDLKLNNAELSPEYSCLDVTYKVGDNKDEKHVQQCIHKLKTSDVCSVLKANNDVDVCTEPTPAPTPPTDPTTKPTDPSTKPTEPTTKPTTKPTDPSTNPTEPPASGLYCYSSAKRRRIECDANNSKLPTNVNNVAPKDQTAEYICVDYEIKEKILIEIEVEVQQCALKLKKGDICDKIKQNKNVTACTTSSPSNSPEPPVYCQSSVDNKMVECNSKNSQLPKGINVDPKEQSTAYTCIDYIIKSGLFRKEEEVQQCALKLTNGNICDTINKNKNFGNCTAKDPEKTTTTSTTTTSTTTQSTTTTDSSESTTDEPESGVYCYSTIEEELVECNSTNSKLPKDANVNPKDQSTDYTCLDYKVKIDSGILENTVVDVQQCALKLKTGEICDMIKTNKQVTECTASDAQASTSKPETTTSGASFSTISMFTISILFFIGHYV